MSDQSICYPIKYHDSPDPRELQWLKQRNLDLYSNLERAKLQIALMRYLMTFPDQRTKKELAINFRLWAYRNLNVLYPAELLTEIVAETI